MIRITDDTYINIANQIYSTIQEQQKEFIELQVDYDTNDFYSTFKFSAILYFSEDGDIEKVLPLWWDFSMNIDGYDVLTDFSWGELENYI